MTQKNKKSSSLTKDSTGFTQIPNNLTNDNRISLKAKGLYCYLYSKPYDWQFFQKNIIRDLKESRKAFDSAIQELESFGWLERIRKKGDDGRFLNYDYHLKTSVRKDTVDNSTSVPFTAVEKANVEKGTDNNNTNTLNNTYSKKEEKLFSFFEEIYKKYNFPKKLQYRGIKTAFKENKNKFNKCLKDICPLSIEKQIDDYLEYLKVAKWRGKMAFSVFINKSEKYTNDWIYEKTEALKRQPVKKLTEKERLMQELETY